MKVLSFSEFKDYCTAKAIERVIYNTVNNERIKDADNCLRNEPLHMSLNFDLIGFVNLCAGVNTIHLISDSGSIAFQCVRRVVLNQYPSWDEARIYCQHGSGEAAYNLLIDY